MAILSAARAGRAAVVALVLAGTLAGCSNREHSNPLDPRNPSTSGAPSGFKAVALSGQVLLSWNRSGDLGTRIYRRALGDVDFAPLTTLLPARNTLFTDPAAANGVTWEYRLYFADDAGLISPPASASATPSKVVAWTADRARGSLIRLAADGREIATEQASFGRPGALTVDRVHNQVWVSDDLLGRVILYYMDSGVLVTVPGFQRPGPIAVDPSDGSAWISDRLAGQIRHIANGGGVGSLPEVSGLDEPAGIDVDPVNLTLWVCEWRGGFLRRYASNGTALNAVALANPWRVAVDSATAEAWVTSYETGRLLHFNPGLSTLRTISSLAGPAGVAVDARRGRIWVCEYNADRVIAFRRDGTEEFRVGGLTDPLEVGVELASGEAWVALRSSIARISPTGTVVATSRGLSAPVGVGLDRLP